MHKRYYAIRDLKAKTFGQLIHMDNDATATRSFGDLITKGDRDSLLATHPEDFQLCYIGTFDVEMGVFTPSENGFTALCIGSDFIK